MHPWRLGRQWGRACVVVFFLEIAGAARAESGPGIFDGAPALYETAPPAPIPAHEPEVLRWIWVEERMDRPRAQAPVRVPLFFSAGECGDPAELAVISWPERTSVVIQCDDIRLAADGGVARLHLWFTADMVAGETRRWALVRRAPASPAPSGPRATVRSGRLHLEAGGTSVEFFTQPDSPRRLAALRLAGGPELDFPGGAGPTLAPDKSMGEETGQGLITWGAGPVFAKVSTIQSGENATLTQTYRLFADGSLNLIQTIAAANVPAVSEQNFLRGEVSGAAALAVAPLPAGVVEGLENYHSGYAVDTLWQSGRDRGWLIMPGTVGGRAGRAVVEGSNVFRLEGPAGFAAGQAGQRGYWAEVTLHPAGREEARPVLLAAAQPLVGVVEHPGVTREMAAARIMDNVLEMKPVGWVNETVIRSLKGNERPFPSRRWQAEADPEYWRAAAQRAYAKLAGDGRVLREDAKGRAAGPLDPYHITYGTTPLVTWLRRDALPPPAHASLRAQLTALRVELGRKDEAGDPYLDVFHRALNMQVGPAMLALADDGLDPEVREFYRALLSSPAFRAVLPRGLRPYAGRAQAKPDESDTIYQAVVDFMLRVGEVVTGEEWGVQRVAFGRYLDAVDVTADQFHPAHPRSDDDAQHFARANFFRTQSHQHRWLGWGPSTFLALLRTAEPGGETPGATEAWRYADALAGRWKNWPDQSWLYLAADLAPVAAQATPASAGPDFRPHATPPGR